MKNKHKNINININNKKLCTYTIILTILAISCSLIASASVVWTSDYVYLYNDGSQLALVNGVTATLTESTNIGTTVTFTDLSVNSAPVVDTTITLQNMNMTITSFDTSTSGTITLSLEGSGTATFTSSMPIKIFIDGEESPQWANQWDYSSGTLTLYSEGEIVIQVSDVPSDEEREQAYNSFMANIFLSLTVIGFVPLLLVIWTMRKGNLDAKTAGIVISLTVILVVMMLIALLIISGMPHSFV